MIRRRGGGRFAVLAGLSVLVVPALATIAAAAPGWAGSARVVPAATPGGAVSSTVVASGPARSLGESVEAPVGAVRLVAATSFGTTTAVEAWATLPGAAQLPPAQPVLPAGFTRSYDPAAASLPGGGGVLVVGAAPAGSCISGGSVFLARVSGTGVVGNPVAVSDQRGQDVFDDRPAVAVGPGGTVYVGWSQGPAADACQYVGLADRPVVAVSHDGGRTFGAPVAVPTPAPAADFGVRLTPLGHGRLAVSWTAVAAGNSTLVLDVVDASGHPGAPRAVIQGVLPPATLPGASFLDFPAGDLTTLGDGRLVAVEPDWVNAQSVLQVATGTLTGRWHPTTVVPPPGTDLFLPALAGQRDGTVRLLAAEHTRSGDGVGYLSTVLTTPPGGPPQAQPWTTAVPVLSGPGYFEIGEEQFLVPSNHHLVAAVVAGGASGAQVESVQWPLSAAPRSPSGAGSPAAGRSALPASALPASALPASALPASRRSRSGGPSSGLLAAAAAVVLVAVLARLRRRARS